MTIIYRILRTYISHFNAVFIEQNESPYILDFDNNYKDSTKKKNNYNFRQLNFLTSKLFAFIEYIILEFLSIWKIEILIFAHINFSTTTFLFIKCDISDFSSIWFSTCSLWLIFASLLQCLMLNLMYHKHEHYNTLIIKYLTREVKKHSGIKY